MPNGISQQNRTHPFFIILRRFADEQKDLSEKAARRFISILVLEGLMTIFVPATVHCVSIGLSLLMLRRCGLAIVGSLLVLFPYSLRRYQRLKALLGQMTYGDVDHMIYSNDYQAASLNYEDIINRVTACTAVNGELKSFLDTVADSLWVTFSVIPVTTAMSALLH